jgi:hypothetical protein
MAAHIAHAFQLATATVVGAEHNRMVQVVPPQHFHAPGAGKALLPEAVAEFMGARYLTMLHSNTGKPTQSAVAYIADHVGKTPDADNACRKLYYVGIPRREGTSVTTHAAWAPRDPHPTKGTRANRGVYDAPAGWSGTVQQEWEATLGKAMGCTCATDPERYECACNAFLDHPIIHVGRPKDPKHLLVADTVSAAEAASAATRWYMRVARQSWRATQGVSTLASDPLGLSMAAAGGVSDDGSGPHALRDIVRGTQVFATPAAAAAITLSAHMHEHGLLGLSAVRKATTLSATTVAFAATNQASVDAALRTLGRAQDDAVPLCAEHMDVSLVTAGLPLRALNAGVGADANTSWVLDTGTRPGMTAHAFPADPRAFLVLQAAGPAEQRGAWLLHLSQDASQARARALELNPQAHRTQPPCMHDYTATVTMADGAVACITLRDGHGMGVDHASCTLMASLLQKGLAATLRDGAPRAVRDKCNKIVHSGEATTRGHGPNSFAGEVGAAGVFDASAKPVLDKELARTHQHVAGEGERAHIVPDAQKCASGAGAGAGEGATPPTVVAVAYHPVEHTACFTLHTGPSVGVGFSHSVVVVRNLH